MAESSMAEANVESDDMEFDDPDDEIFPLGHHTYRDMEDKSPYFQVEKQPDEFDDILVDQQIHMDATAINTISKEDVVALLWLEGLSRWYFQTLQTMSEQAGDYRFYHSAIKVAAYIVYMLFTKEYLYEAGPSATLKTQLNQLWEKFAVLGKQGFPVDKVCELIVNGKLIQKTDSLVTELEVTDMLTEYQRTLPCPKYFKLPYTKYFTCAKTEEIEKDMKAVLDCLENIVHNMEPPRKPEVDGFTRVLIMLARTDGEEYRKQFAAIADVMLSKDGLSRLRPLEDQPSLENVDDHLRFLIPPLFKCAGQRIRRQLARVHKPLDDLMISEDVKVSSFVYDIIEVAELRRCALGSRFINRKHLIWAFYECGYGLPRSIRNMSKLNIVDEDGLPHKIRNMTKLNIDKDHPPYHIYWTSYMLTKWLAVNEMRVEHFIFAVLYSKDTMVDDSQMAGLAHDFTEFMQAVALDSRERPRKIRVGS